MSGSVISPWVFYLINFLENLSRAMIALLVVSVIIFVGAVVFWLIFDEEEEDNKKFGPEDRDYKRAIYYKKLLSKLAKISIVFVMLSSVFAITIPSTETMYTMLVAKYTTYENIDKATNTIKDGVDYIFDKLDGDK